MMDSSQLADRLIEAVAQGAEASELVDELYLELRRPRARVSGRNIRYGRTIGKTPFRQSPGLARATKKMSGMYATVGGTTGTGYKRSARYSRRSFDRTASGIRNKARSRQALYGIIPTRIASPSTHFRGIAKGAGVPFLYAI